MMSETNQIRSIGIQNAFQLGRRTSGFVAPQHSFEEELLKIRFFATEVEAEPTNEPVLPLEPAPKNEKTSDEDLDSENGESKKPTETDDASGEYVYSVIVPPTTVVNDAMEEDAGAKEIATEGEFGVHAEPISEESAAGTQNSTSPKIAADEKVAISALENEETSSVQLTAEIQIGELTEGAEEPQQTNDVLAPSSYVESPLQQMQIETIAKTPHMVEGKSGRSTRETSRTELGTELDSTASKTENPESPDVGTEKKDGRPIVNTASLQSVEEKDSEAEPKEGRRAERLERNRVEFESTIEENLAPPTNEAYLDTQFSSETAIESMDTDSTTTEQIVTSSTETVTSPVIVSSQQTNIPALQSSISTPAGIVANASLNANPSNSQSSGAVSITNNIGGSSSTSASREATGSSRVNLTPYQESKLVQRVLRGIEQLGNGGGQVRIRLHPPELGTLQMTLKFEATQVSAQFEVENRAARDALLSNSQVLKDKLKEQGLEVQKFEVEVRSDVNDSLNSSTGDRQERGNSSSGRDFESRFAIANRNRINSEARQEPELSVMPWVRTKGSLDLSA